MGAERLARAAGAAGMGVVLSGLLGGCEVKGDFGLVLADEQHGNGPRHLAATLGNGAVLETYPATSPHPTDGNPSTEPRLGFTVDDIDAVLPAIQIASGTIAARPTPLHAADLDPEGRPIHITAHR